MVTGEVPVSKQAWNACGRPWSRMGTACDWNSASSAVMSLPPTPSIRVYTLPSASSSTEASSSDLAPSTRAALDARLGDFGPVDYAGRTMHFGVREAAAAVANGLALSGLRPFQAGFLVFSDFQRGPVRLSALMRQPVIHVYTHDSISMGEDGPTHQPVEHLAGLRAIPGLVDIRPADANEVTGAWRAIMGIGDRAVALVLSKQDMPVLEGTNPAALDGVGRGAYRLVEPEVGPPQAVIIATGSEVALAVAAHDLLAVEGIPVRVVSMPSWALFAEQSRDYRFRLLPPTLTARVAVEQAATFGWERYTGDQGTIIGMTTFGASGPGSDVRAHFGFTPAAIASAVRQTIERSRNDASQ